MLFKTFKGYMEGADLSTIPMGYFGLPSKNFIIRKGVAYTRPGITNDGTLPTGNYKITGSHSFKDAPAGAQSVRTTADGRFQLKYAGKWITLSSSILTPGHKRVRFSEWLDTLNAVIKKRLFFVDGSNNLNEWAGALSVIKAITSAGGNITGVFTLPHDATGSSPANMSGGAGYAVNDVLDIAGGGGSGAQLLVIQTSGTTSLGGFKAGTFSNAGSGYSVGSVLTFAGTGGTAAIIKVTSVDGGGAITGYIIIHSGDNYVPGSNYTASGGTSGTNAIFTPSAVGAVIVAWRLITQGTGYSTGSNLATIGGSGTGATVQINSIAASSVVIEDLNSPGNITALAVADGGSGYVVNDVLTLQLNGTVAATVQVLSVNGSGVILYAALSIAGNGYTYGETLTSSGGTGIDATFTVLATGSSIEQLGYDYPGNASAENTDVYIVRFSSPGVVAGVDTYSLSEISGNIFDFSSALSTPPSVGDIVVSKIVQHTNLSSFLKDDIYTYQNHLAVANLQSHSVYFSDAVAYLDFTVPDSDATSASPFLIQLPGNYTAMRNRLNPQTQLGVCWISCADSWTKVTQAFVADADGNYITAVNITETDSLGALPFMVADYKGDPIYLAQDFSLQRIESVEAVGKDAFKILSDEVSDLLARLDWTEGRLDYTTRYVYLIAPASGTLVLLDMIEEAWQPPQDMPIASISNIAGALCGHSCVKDETFELWTGRNDLGAPIKTVFAPGYYLGFQFHRGKTLPQDFNLKEATKFAFAGRMTKGTIVQMELNFENDGALAKKKCTLDGRTAKLYKLPHYLGWGLNIFGKKPFGIDTPETELWRVFAWKKWKAVQWFEWRPVFTATPVPNDTNQEFHLIAFYLDDTIGDQTIPESLWIPESAYQF
jgi:hypothetical protein